MNTRKSFNIGVGYRREVADQIYASAREFDCLEVLVEHFVPLTFARRAELERLRERFMIVPHCVSLSLGSVGVMDLHRWAEVRAVLDVLNPPYVSDHASISRAGGVDLWHLSPIWRTKLGLAALVENLNHAQDFFGMPVAIETITEPFRIPNADYEWDEFLVEACSRSGAGLLVDITNLWINFKNGIWPRQDGFFGCLGGARWYQWHIVGYGQDETGSYIDAHENPITSDLFDALDVAAKIQIPAVCIVERDGRLGDFSEVLSDVLTIRQHAQQAWEVEAKP